MSKTLEAVFDGEALRPDGPLELELNTRVRITIEPAEPRRNKSKSFISTALSLNLQGPPDWATRFDGYLYDGERL